LSVTYAIAPFFSYRMFASVVSVAVLMGFLHS